MNRIIPFLFCILIFSCKKKSSEEFEKHQTIIKSELQTGKFVEFFFLGFKFDDNIKEYRNKLDSLNNIDKIQAYRYKEGRDTLDNVKYEFKGIAELNGIDFLVHPKRHNDSLKGITLSATDKRMWRLNNHSEQFLFEKLIEEYTLKYGEPNYKPKDNNVFWINGNLEINIQLSKPSKVNGDKLESNLSVSYRNTKKEQELLNRKYRNVLFLGFDTVDRWYYDQKEKNKRPLEDI